LGAEGEPVISRERLDALWRVALPLLATAWLLVLFGGLFVWGRGGDKPGWWWLFVVALAPLGFYFWRREKQ
jgi:hypothetical protein